MNIAPGEIGAAAAPLNRARSMPAGFYTDPEIFRREREMIFLKHWFFLCRDDQLPAAGDYRSFDTPGGPIVLLRSRDGQLRCFANYCRHRGSILLEGRGNTGSRIICPYHAWSYFTDGSLYGCPDMKDAEGFDRVENGLVPLRLDSFAGFLFANFAADGTIARRASRRPAAALRLAPARPHALGLGRRSRAALQLEAHSRKRHGDLSHRHGPQGLRRRPAVAHPSRYRATGCASRSSRAAASPPFPAPSRPFRRSPISTKMPGRAPTSP